jgi:hypothetical protein
VTDPRNLNVETMTGELKPGMQLLCGDGLTEEVDDHNIAGVLAHDRPRRNASIHWSRLRWMAAAPTTSPACAGARH